MRAGLTSYAVAWNVGVPGYSVAKPMDAFGFLDLVAELGLSCAQFADNLPLRRLSPAERRRLLGRAEALGVSFEVGLRGLDEERLVDYIEIAAEFGSPILRAVIDRGDYQPELCEVARLIEANLERLDRAGICLAIENHDRLPVAVLRQLVDCFPLPQVGVCLDTVNSLGCGEGWQVVVDTLAPATVNLHVKDFRIQRLSHNMGFEVLGTPFGEGAFDRSIFRRLAERGICQTAALENWVPYAGDTEVAAALELEWCRSGAVRLKHELEQRSGDFPVPEQAERPIA